ncbi:MAG TPA: hypothetical protein VF698_07045, partial [Thermoanaerobaculia bacterium]
GVRLFDAALKRLEPFPLVHCGVDRTEAEAAARRDRGWAAGAVETGEKFSEAYPRLVLVDAETSPMPPRDSW